MHNIFFFPHAWSLQNTKKEREKQENKTAKKRGGIITLDNNVTSNICKQTKKANRSGKKSSTNRHCKREGINKSSFYYSSEMEQGNSTEKTSQNSVTYQDEPEEEPILTKEYLQEWQKKMTDSMQKEIMVFNSKPTEEQVPYVYSRMMAFIVSSMKEKLKNKSSLMPGEIGDEVKRVLYHLMESCILLTNIDSKVDPRLWIQLLSTSGLLQLPSKTVLKKTPPAFNNKIEKMMAKALHGNGKRKTETEVVLATGNIPADKPKTSGKNSKKKSSQDPIIMNQTISMFKEEERKETGSEHVVLQPANLAESSSNGFPLVDQSMDESQSYNGGASTNEGSPPINWDNPNLLFALQNGDFSFNPS